MATASLPRLTAQQYLEIERKAEFRSEYFDGQMFAMAGATYDHNRLVANLNGELYLRLRNGSCAASANDLRVRIGADKLYTYPDLVVICGDPQFADDRKDTVLNPVLIVEVLSESTEAKDRGFKFHHYRAIETLMEYVLVSQKEPRIEIFRRASAKWEIEQYVGPEAVARFTSIDCEIPLSDVYRDVGAWVDS